MRITQLIGIFALGTAMSAGAAPRVVGPARTSGTYVPALGYVTSGGRGLALMLANEDGTGGQTAYRYASGSQYDLTSPARHLVAVADSHRILMFSWSLNGSTLVTTTPILIYAPPTGVFGDAPAFSPDGSKLAYFSSDGFVHVIDSATRQELVRFASDYANEINWTADGNSILVLSPEPGPSISIFQFPATGGPGTLLLTEPNIDSFDTSRIPGDSKLLVSYSRGSALYIGVWDGSGYLNTRAVGFQVNWNCAMTKVAYKSAANNGPTLYSYDYGTGNSTVLYSGGQGRQPRYMKCDATALLTNARRMHRRPF